LVLNIARELGVLIIWGGWKISNNWGEGGLGNFNVEKVGFLKKMLYNNCKYKKEQNNKNICLMETIVNVVWVPAISLFSFRT